MATVLRFVRGNTIRWTTVFYDQAGNVATPSGANLIVSIETAPGVKTPQTPIAMTYNAGPANWTADWESETSLNCLVEWTVRTTGATPKIVEQGSFQLEANSANIKV